MNMKHPVVVAVGAFLAVWGTTSNFALDYRSILGSIVAVVARWQTIAMQMELQFWPTELFVVDKSYFRIWCCCNFHEW